VRHSAPVGGGEELRRLEYRDAGQTGRHVHAAGLKDGAGGDVTSGDERDGPISVHTAADVSSRQKHYW
jgi:hypothetical protein